MIIMYPRELLPRSNYKLIITDLSNYYLLRTVTINNFNDVWDEEDNCLKPAALDSKFLPDLSTNLLSIYNYSHVKIHPTSEGRRKYTGYCDPNITIDERDTPQIEIDYTIDERKHAWAIQIDNIKGKEVVYELDGEPDSFSATCTVKHTPTRWNFWHFSVDWFLHGINLTLSELESVNQPLFNIVLKRLKKDARDTIIRHGTIHPIEPTFLDTSHYIA